MKFNPLILFAIFSFFLFSCDSGVKFNNPNDINSDAYNPESSENGTNDEDIDQTDSDPTDSEQTDTEPDNPDSTPEQPDNGDSEPDDTDIDDSDSAPDNSDSTPDDDTDTADSNDDSGNSQPDESNTTDDGDTSAPDEDTVTTRTETCSGLPANASWHNGSSITQTFDGNDWYPPATGFYSETAVANECGFKCNQGYDWNGDWGKCFIRPAFGNICTGQTSCYDNSEEIPCPESGEDFYGQDAQYAKLGYCYPPSFSIKTNASGENIVVDNNTGLEWHQVISEDSFTWEDAITYCENLNYSGHNDWRLPNPQELLTIVDNSRYAPAVNTTYFPNTPNTYFNTSTNHANPSSTNVWAFDHNQGFVDNFSIDGSRRVRCVRGQELAIASFTTSSDGYTVTDSTTGLMWQKTYETGKTWQEALAYCQSLNTEGYGGYSTEWRLPNKNEIASLVNYGKVSPASDFPDMPPSSDSNWFWSSSSTSSSPNNVWRLYFPNGAVRENTNKTGTTNVLCVRSEKINDPCENHICGSVAHSSGVCVPENAFEYSCACDNGYFWNGNQCKIMPECSASSGTPCKDSTNHLTWSPLASNDMTQPNALNYCENLVLYGFSDWHLPTIDELRTLIKNCPGTETNGACAISEKNGKLSESDSSSSCSCTHMNNNGGYYSKIGDDATVSPWSSSSRSDDTERAWYVGFFAGKINNSEKSVLSDVRCVRNAE